MADSPGPITFGADGEAATFSYSVPLPASHTGRRILKLDDAVAIGEWNAEAASTGVELIAELPDPSTFSTYDIKEK